MKKGLAGILFFLLILLSFPGTALCEVGGGAMSEETLPEGSETDAAGEWVMEGEEWRYKLTNHEYLEREWIYDSGKWYYLDEDGYLSIGTRRIDGEYYYFRENGEMATGWAYDEDTSQWYYMNENGTRKTGWLQTGGVWYWFDSKGVMFQNGNRMIDAHKYYFFENGQMAANKFIELNYYDKDGLRDRQYSITIQGKRKPTEEEKTAISNAMEGIPGEWIEKCLKSGWEFMFYTDKDFFAAPATEQGVYYIYHKTDTNYKKIKFTKPESLVMAIGEYIAFTTGNDKEESGFLAEFWQYLSISSLVEPLPSYFDDKPEVWFGRLLESYSDAAIFYDITKQAPDLAKYLTDALGTDQKGQKPSLEELRDLIYEESGDNVNSKGPSTDLEVKKPQGPASAG